MTRHKIYYEDGSLQREIARAYKVIAACKGLLEQSRPDTFLGRQRHEPIPPTTTEVRQRCQERMEADQQIYRAMNTHLFQTRHPDCPSGDTN